MLANNVYAYNSHLTCHVRWQAPLQNIQARELFKKTVCMLVWKICKSGALIELDDDYLEGSHHLNLCIYCYISLTTNHFEGCLTKCIADCVSRNRLQHRFVPLQSAATVALKNVLTLH